MLGSYSELWLYVYFDKDTYKEALQEFSQDDEETEIPALEEVVDCEETTVAEAPMEEEPVEEVDESYWN